MDYGEVQKLWVKGLGYVADKHIYKYKDYSECVFDTQIESKEWLCHELKKVVPENFNHVSVLAGWYGMVLVPFLYQTFGEINIDLYDVDEYTTDIAKYIWNEHSKVNVYTKDVVFDNIDYITSKIMLPLGGLLMALFAGYIMKKAIVLSELNSNTLIASIWLIIIKVFSPILLVIVFIKGII